MQAPICLTEFNADKRRKSGFCFDFDTFFILFLEDNWSEEIKIDETAMNNAAEEEKPEQGRCSGQFYTYQKLLTNF